jgi:hypothetical protein
MLAAAAGMVLGRRMLLAHALHRPCADSVVPATLSAHNRSAREIAS